MTSRKPITVKLDVEQIELIELGAEKNNLPRSSYMRELLKQALQIEHPLATSVL